MTNLDIPEIISEALRDQGELQRLFEMLPVGCLLTRESDGLIIKANQAFLALIEFSWSEVEGGSLVELNVIQPEARQRFLDHLSHTGQSLSLILPCRTRSGRQFFSRFTVRTVKVGGMRCLLSIADLAEGTDQFPLDRRFDHRDLLETKNRLERQFDLAPLGVVRSNRSRITYVNDYGCALIGFSRQELLDRSPTDNPVLPSTHLLAGNGGTKLPGSLSVLDLVVVAKDGRREPIRTHSTFVPSSTEYQGEWLTFFWSIAGEVELRDKQAQMMTQVKSLYDRYQVLRRSLGGSVQDDERSRLLAQRLSDKDRVWLGYLRQGLSNVEIARLSGRSLGVVKVTNSRLFSKLGVRNRLELYRWLL